MLPKTATDAEMQDDCGRCILLALGLILFVINRRQPSPR